MMTICTLAEKEINPAEPQTKAYDEGMAFALFEQLGEPWQLVESAHKLYASYQFKNFKKALHFVNALGMVSDAAMHHPDIQLGWGYVKLEIQTHSLGGLHEADFILAAKIQCIYDDLI